MIVVFLDSAMDIGLWNLASASMFNDTSSLTAALIPLGLDARAITMDGDFPNLAALRLDLTGAHFHRGLRFADAVASEAPAFFARTVEAGAAPAYFESLPFSMSLHMEDAVFSSKAALIRSGKGALTLSATMTDLENTLLDLVRTAAEKQGAEAQSVQLNLHAESPRALVLRATATARAMFLTATLTLSGRIEITENLEARLCALSCSGDGMIANLAVGALRPKLAAIDGKTLAMRALIPSLHTLTLDTKDGLQLRALFG